MVFNLYPHQVNHVTDVINILKEDFFAIDLSMLGSGKTYTATKIAEELKVKHIIVIAPTSVKSKWLAMQRDHGLPISACLSFNEVRSSTCRQPKHGLLSRRDYKVTPHNGEEINKVKFNATPALHKIASEGCLLIIDEIQNIKNLTTQFHACREIIKAIKTANSSGGHSHALLLSGSPIDKHEQTVHLFRCLDIMKVNKLCDYVVADGRFTTAGYTQIEDYCLALGNQTGEHDKCEPFRGNAAACLSRVYRMFQGKFKAHRTCAMDPPNSRYGICKLNGYFDIQDTNSSELLSRGVKSLAIAASFNPENGTVTYGSGGDSIAAITTALMMIETAKISTFVRLAREALSKDANARVVICVNYTATLKDLTKELAEYSPLIMNGTLSAQQRGRICTEFASADSARRLLIGNASVCSTGIDLDDKHGNQPRIVFVSPMYNTITLYQLSHRFLRLDTRSSSQLFMVYGKNASETRVLRALGKKSSVMKETTAQQVDSGVKFPGDFDSYIEGESVRQ